MALLSQRFGQSRPASGKGIPTMKNRFLLPLLAAIVLSLSNCAPQMMGGSVNGGPQAYPQAGMPSSMQNGGKATIQGMIGRKDAQEALGDCPVVESKLTTTDKVTAGLGTAAVVGTAIAASPMLVLAALAAPDVAIHAWKAHDEQIALCKAACGDPTELQKSYPGVRPDLAWYPDHCESGVPSVLVQATPPPPKNGLMQANFDPKCLTSTSAKWKAANCPTS